jgi:FkbM family methyltransferase
VISLPAILDLVIIQLAPAFEDSAELRYRNVRASRYVKYYTQSCGYGPTVLQNPSKEDRMIGEQLRGQKNRLEADLRKALFGRRIFSPLRNAYQFVFNRDKLSNRRQMRELYSRYIRRGDLVFDVGANVGIYTELFLELGARVVAVEPNPHCCRVIERLAHNRNVTIESCAAGGTAGKILLQLSDNTQLSTVNQEWLKSVQRSPLHAGANWLGEIAVELTTLDRLAEKHGIPNFVKIDVEGFEDQVIRGMSFKPDARTFEFNRLLQGVAMKCLGTPMLSSGYDFNYLRGSMKCASQEWLSAEALAARINTLVGEEQSGDIIARRIAAR